LDKIKNITIASAVALLSIIIIFLVIDLPLIQNWNKQINDIVVTSCPEKPSDDIVIVTIDQNSINQLRKNYKILWPWPRSLYGRVTEYLSHSQAKSILFDILFSRSDINRVNQNTSLSDSIFAQSMRENDVTLALQLEDSTHETNHPIVKKRKNIQFNLPDQLIREFPQATLPIPKFQKSARNLGTVNFYTDEDGICRKIPLFYKYNNHIFPFLSLSGLISAHDIKKISFDKQSGKLIAGPFKFNINKNGFLNIRWYGKGGVNETFKYVSFINLVKSYQQWKAGKKPILSPNIFRDKTIFIGATAAGLWDVKPTPYTTEQAPFPGIEIYATVYSNMVQEKVVSRISFLKISVILFLALLLFNLAWRKYRLYFCSVVTITYFIIPLGLHFYFYSTTTTHIPSVGIWFATLLSLIGIVTYNYWSEGRQRQLIKNIFQNYMHPEIIDRLTQNYEEVKLGGEKVQGTVLFTDIEGFTGLAEKLDSQDTVQLLNNYFQQLEQIIFENGGMIDKYLGDGLMAIFGPPLNQPGHAEKASQTILDIQEIINKNFTIKGQDIRLKTRIGVTTGEILVGNLGSSNRMDYTAIGNSVNLAARLEGVNKTFNTNNIISGFTYNQVQEKFVCRKLGNITVKGLSKSLDIYCVICTTEKIDQDTKILLNLHQKALKLYRNDNFEAALHRFTELRSRFPDDQITAYYIKQCQRKLEGN